MRNTGDIFQRTKSGDLIYIGRSDDQVKINGKLFHLNEIHERVMAISSVQQCR
jgi:D-alanine--poly(phosphoribitol) ligase subunit 1